MNVLSLFSGIGAFEKALDRLKIPYNLVNYCEIDKYASRSYAAVHGVPESLNLGDVSKVDTSKLPHIDMITYGFPCQDISLAGKQKGLLDEGGKQTRSGLFFEALRIIEDTKPRVAIAENVKNFTSKKFKEQFEKVLDSLNFAGYNNHYTILNSKNFGVPQHRERLFIVSVRKDIDTGFFNFPEPIELKLCLKDLLEKEINPKYYIADKIVSQLCNIDGDYITVRENTKKGYAEAGDGDSINFEQPNSKTRRGRVGKQVAQTITTSPQQGVVINPLKGKSPYGWHFEQQVYDAEGITRAVKAGGGSGNIPKVIIGSRIKKLTPLECWRLQGFDDEDFYKAEKVCSNNQLYKQAGNSITVNVLEFLFSKIIEAGILN